MKYLIENKNNKKTHYIYNEEKDTWNKYSYIEKDSIIYSSSNLEDKELLKFQKPFLIPEKNLEISLEKIEELKNNKNNTYKEIDTSRNYYRLNEKQIASKNEDKIDFNKLIKNIQKSKIRATKAFFDYARNYKWEYFCTFTFEEENIRNSRNLIKSRWSSFIKELKKLNNEVKVIAVVEEHKKGGYHLHSLIKDISLPLVPARNNDKTSKNYNTFLFTKEGNQIFNLNLWKNGFSTVSIINKEDNNNKVINYCSKYLVKNIISGYCQKSFFKTSNLEKIINF